MRDRSNEKERNGMTGLGWLLLILVAWVVLQAFILPKMGIST